MMYLNSVFRVTLQNICFVVILKLCMRDVIFSSQTHCRIADNNCSSKPLGLLCFRITHTETF